MPPNAASDVIMGLGRGSFWARTAVWDIRRRYASSVLGPVWMSAGLLATSFAVGFIYSRLFSYGEGYLAYVTAGFMVWYFVVGALTDSMHAFQIGSAAILFSSGPLSIHVYRIVLRELIVMAHNVIVFLGVAIVVGALGDVLWHWAILGLLLDLIALTGFAIALACFATLYDDIRPMMGFILTLAMFVTPLFWYPDAVSGLRAAVVHYNPFYHIVAVVRDPLLGSPPTMMTLMAMVGIAGGGVLSGVLTLQFTRKKIPLQL